MNIKKEDSIDWRNGMTNQNFFDGMFNLILREVSVNRGEPPSEIATLSTSQTTWSPSITRNILTLALKSKLITVFGLNSLAWVKIAEQGILTGRSGSHQSAVREDGNLCLEWRSGDLDHLSHDQSLCLNPNLP